jgi:arabinose-5-phosphate isomerase
MTLLVEKGFKIEDFASLHPGGKIGKQLARVDSLMHSGDTCPSVRTDAPMKDVIYEMSSKGLGMTCVVDGDAALRGIITDGDLRRQMARLSGTVMGLRADEVMTKDPVTISPATLAAQALNVLERRKITSIVVVDDQRRVQGVLHIHDLWRTELF